MITTMYRRKPAAARFARLGNRLSVFMAALTLLAIVGTAVAQTDVPFQVMSSTGTLAQLPDPTNPEQMHVINSGSATLGGNTLSYTGSGTVRLLAPPDPTTGIAPFESAEPFLFDFGNGDVLPMHYGRTDFGAPSSGMVQLTPLPSGLLDVTWLATFNPVPGAGTGQFADVTAGQIFMTAEMDAVDPMGMDLPYTWSSDVGVLTFVPEPATSVLALVVLVVAGARRAVQR